METTYYTLTAHEIVMEGAGVEQASGGAARQVVCARRTGSQPAPGQGKVIDLAAWRAAQEEDEAEALWAQDAFAYEDEEDGEAEEAPVSRSYAARPRRGRKSALNGELWACVAVVGVMAVLLLRILCTF